MIRIHRAFPLLALPLFAACSSAPPSSVLLENQARCPQQLAQGQMLILRLPSNPSTGYRWELLNTPDALRSLGPEVYSSPDKVDMVGAAGHSTWRFQATAAGKGSLRLAYQRPWEPEPIEHFECRLEVR
ncbi:protease inhibitor I42 family protein [Pseudomonas mangrovi]|uniref:Peptidase inhibitor I42 n=1 Tax=Pseudomonas mangrovi TaxID=2161748 RepID=A0A2T5PEG2_9PSED|nr:protease inhibitor I42 family protein [Pseudomonas mangrovi]PTU76108.1 peptidase inhibitor I42 [Pseudomonas mangrovi]